jgi:hypothetical protein
MAPRLPCGRFRLWEFAGLKSAKKAALSLLIALALCAAPSLLALPSVRAATSYVLSPTDPGVAAICTSLGGTWDGSRACTIGSNLDLGSGDSIVVDPGAFLVVARGVTLANNGTIDDYGDITISAGGVVDNSGTIAAFIGNGTITNDGSIKNRPVGSIVIQRAGQTSPQVGSFDFTNSGVLDNGGNFTSFGNLTNSAAGYVTNSGSFDLGSATINVGNFSAPLTTNAGNFTNATGGTVTNDGATINNTGMITNAGTIVEKQNVFSIIDNFGTIKSDGTITIQAYMGNNATIINSGTITTVVGCPIADCGTLANNAVLINTAGGTIDISGNFGNNSNATLTNDGSLTNSRLMVNNRNATIMNSGAFDSSGTLSNFGSIDNSGSISNSGTFLNSGNVANGPGASITNARLITNDGGIANSGTITNACGGVIFGPGMVSGTPVTTTSACPATTTPAPEFPTEMLGPVTLSLLAVFLLAFKKGVRNSKMFEG